METILFICVQNSDRSQMAEAFFNASAKERGLDVRAESAGTRGAGALSILAVKAMDEIGVSMEGQMPRMLKPDILERADRIVSMGINVVGEGNSKFVPTDSWEVPDPNGRAFGEIRVIRDEIRARVEELVNSLTPAAKP